MKKRKYCSVCSREIENRKIDDRIRDYCSKCDIVHYDNPLPVASSVIVNTKREILLVLRKNEPKKGMWGLPSGFAEIDETIEEASLRELNEEAGITGEVLRLLDTRSHYNDFYGDLIWVTFEVNWISGDILPGDDAIDAKFFSLFDLPDLAFKANQLAVEKYINRYKDLWKMQDSFKRLEGGRRPTKGNLPSDSLFDIINRDSQIITDNWVAEVMSHPTTEHYSTQPKEEVYDKAHIVISQFGKWMIHPDQNMDEIWEYFKEIGNERREDGYKLSEVISALSLTRKHIFAHVFAQGGVWVRPIEMYRSMEFTSRVNLFFDKATYHISKGYEME
ncbi:MAG: NUDIX hydrolase [Candidatus Marinimicrobia bacterium]|nr:NUDIX hydrolase [Candidatus Neomarinimicrobiota bacterium]MBL7022704.1 NUDIX hydrolase [Candidatus Neomarinimicrobiota bacterium]MBL7109167.1 NUDIX hydrolase [Candidatus Neomarinimicrobiota bacterium]